MKKIINIVLFLLSLTLVSCGTITSGTSTTKIVSSDPFSVDIRVYTDFDRSNILTELRKADKLAALHCRSFNKISLPYDTDNSFFKTVKYQCITKKSTRKNLVSVDLKNLTDSVMNGWRADYKNQMGSLINSSGCSSSVNLTNLTDSVMNGWRADYKQQMGSILSCSSCSSSVNLTNLTDSVMNGWRADYKQQMSSLISCIEN